ncbi:ABC transporter ATP-binding protein [Streptomyces sp. NPDC048282]|uniref:ABC transporter ATP-binding protein n=1 Tax=Streptomyces sp. NPDC048282 TaxID=3365528 RepID=UPI003722D5D3
MADTPTPTGRIPDVQAEVIEHFTALCGNPDDTSAAAAADRALTSLEKLLLATADTPA